MSTEKFMSNKYIINNIMKGRYQANYRKKYSNNNSSIWIINDRLNFGGDNGEYFFRYLKQKNPKNIKFYFVINSNSSDYRRLKSLGNIIEYGSDLHLNLYLKVHFLIFEQQNFQCLSIYYFYLFLYLYNYSQKN